MTIQWHKIKRKLISYKTILCAITYCHVDALLQFSDNYDIFVCCLFQILLETKIEVGEDFIKYTGNLYHINYSFYCIGNNCLCQIVRYQR